MTLEVAFDVSGLNEGFKDHAHRGIGRYVRELKNYFEKAKLSNGLEVKPFDFESLRGKGSIGLQLSDKIVERLPLGRMTLRQQVLYPFQLQTFENQQNSKKETIFHFPAHMDAPCWGLRNYILTVLDLIPLVCADLYKAEKSGLRFAFARWLELKAMRNASLILAISENTARDVHRMLDIPREKIVVTPLGVDQKFFDVQQKSKPQDLLKRLRIICSEENVPPIVLYVGGIDPRKNYKFLLETFKSVLETSKNPTPILIMAGNIQSDREYPKLCRLIEEFGLTGKVFLPGFVNDSDLLELYTISSVFFFPSLYEGFGLPPLEAMAAGLPVVSSHTSAMPEVLGDAALSINPFQVRDAKDALLSVLNSPEKAQNLKESGQRQARLFSWERTGAATIAAYQRFEGLSKATLPRTEQDFEKRVGNIQ